MPESPGRQFGVSTPRAPVGKGAFRTNMCPANKNSLIYLCSRDKLLSDARDRRDGLRSELTGDCAQSNKCLASLTADLSSDNQ